jgi:hypothetical protein
LPPAASGAAPKPAAASGGLLDAIAGFNKSKLKAKNPDDEDDGGGSGGGGGGSGSSMLDAIKGFSVAKLKKNAERKLRDDRPAPSSSSAAKPSMMEEMMARMNRRRSIMNPEREPKAPDKPSMADVVVQKSASAASGLFKPATLAEGGSDDGSDDGGGGSNALVLAAPVSRKHGSDSDSDASAGDWDSD